MLVRVVLATLLLASAAVAQKPLEVFIVPHSHCDVGWLQTVEGYYNSSVHSILNTVVEALDADSSLRFIWSEIKWFQMWWPVQTPQTQETFRRLVRNGQLEFVGAGWSQSDEVTTTWRDVVDQVTTGHEYLRRTLGEDVCARCVRYGWQIDMFAGYSGVTPTLWALMGYDGMVIRFEGPDDMRRQWTQNKWFEYIWHGSANIPSNRSGIFTHVIEWNYGTFVGQGFNWGPTSSNPSMNASTVQAAADRVAAWAYNRTQVYQGPILIAWGSDFNFPDAHAMFGNMTYIIDYINKNEDRYHIHIQYGTLSNYFDYLNSLHFTFPVMEFIDFEYGWPHVIPQNLSGNVTIQYQTGAPTSRSAHKQHIRQVSRLHRDAETAHALVLAQGRESKAADEQLMVAWDALGVTQHHDSVPGTMSAKGTYTRWGGADHNPGPACNDTNCMVLEDYGRRLDDGADASSEVLSDSLRAMAAAPSDVSLVQDGHRTTIVVYNSLSHLRNHIVTVQLPRPPRPGAVPTILDSNNQPVLAQLDAFVQQQVHFEASVPPLGHATYYITFNGSFPAVRPSVVRGASVISGAALRVTFNANGEMQSIQNFRDDSTIAVKQQYFEYFNSSGGPYCLIETNAARAVPAPTAVQTVTGPLFQEVLQTYKGVYNLEQRVRLAKGADYIQVYHTLNTLDLNTEIVSRLTTDLDTKGFIFTDDSGLEMHARPLQPSLPISGNYHAMVQSSYIRDTTVVSTPRALAVLTGHTMGVAALGDGQLEYMMLRNINSTDDQGPWPLLEQGPFRAETWLLAGLLNEVEEVRMARALQHENPLVVGYTTGHPSRLRSQGVSPLPENVYLMSWFVRTGTPAAGHTEYVLRLQNVAEHSADVTVDLSTLFPSLTKISVEETTLALDTPHQRQPWGDLHPAPMPRGAVSSPLVTLSSLDMRTFVVRVG
eukprot:m.231252 g.231252  ORF g.231252 m.231252 type:complete len:935 (-) comp18297_c0_seq1:121-2925(-)